MKKANEIKKNVLLEYLRLETLPASDLVFKSRGIGITYSLTGFKIEIKRRSFKFIFNNYIPSALFVVVSWASFLIPPDLIPGRMNLLIGLFLVLINSFNSATAKIPNSEGINALVAYLFTCIFFVFAALACYAGKEFYFLFVIIFLLINDDRNPFYKEQKVQKNRGHDPDYLCPG